MNNLGYISVDKLIDFANNHINKTIDANDIARFPRADVVEQRHGEWIPLIQNYHWADTGVVDNIIIGYRCSVCGEIEKFNYKYCHCGAIMDLKEIKDSIDKTT